MSIKAIEPLDEATILMAEVYKFMDVMVTDPTEPIEYVLKVEHNNGQHGRIFFGYKPERAVSDSDDTNGAA